MSLNKVILIGNLGKDPELRHTTTGMAVCNFSVATNRKTKDASGNEVKETEWHRVTVWREQAGLCDKYLRKGSQVCVEGSIKTDKWKDKEGNDRATVGITAHKVMFLGSGEKTEGENAPVKSPPTNPTKSAPRMGYDLKEEFTEENIPF